MENYSFKSVTFGGFDKQDVVRYIEQASEKAAAVQKQLEDEREELQKQLEEQVQKAEMLQAQVKTLTEQRVFRWSWILNGAPSRNWSPFRLWRKK